jgi:uncharacterized protein DUF2795
METVDTGHGQRGGDQPQAAPATGADDANEFSRLGRYIGRSTLPGDRDALIRSADVLLAPDDILADLRRLPDETVYHTVTEIWSALGRGPAPEAR